VAVVGGGYGGISAAKALDDIADVTLIEPRDTFVHNVAALRAVVDPEWAEHLFIPYDRLLARGRVRRDRAVRVSATTVELASGAALTPDFTVLATGSTHRYPAKIDIDDADRAVGRLRATHTELARASRVLLLGAGPVGLEFAGEIKAAWPGKAVTIIDPRPTLMPGQFPEEFRKQLQAQLDEMGIELLLETSLNRSPLTGSGLTSAFTVTTSAGAAVTADIWFACYGASPVTGYLAPDLHTAGQPGSLISVTPELRLPGHSTLFAIGDITAMPEMKMARQASRHAEVAAANIRTLIDGQDTMATYHPAADAIVLPLGPKGGVTYAPEAGVLDASATSGIKGSGLFVDTYREILGAGQ